MIDRSLHIDNSPTAQIDSPLQQAQRRFKLGLTFTILLLIVFFGFIGAVGFDRQIASIIIVPGLSLAILLGILSILAMCLLSFAYAAIAD